MNTIYIMIIYVVVLLLIVFMFLLRKWIKIGLAVLMKKKTVIFIVNDNRRLELHTQKIIDKKIKIDESVYFAEPKKTFLMSLMYRLHLKKKKELPIILEQENKITEYDVDEERMIFFGNTPCYIFRKDNPEALDLYSDKSRPIITGSYLNNIFKKSLMATNLEWLDKIGKYMPFIIIIGGIVALVLAGGVAYFLIKGLTPQVAGGTGAQIIKV